MTFKELNIKESILKALRVQGYTQPTPIQEQAIPILLRHKDLLGCAQTGTGKTAAFAIPIIQHLSNDSSRNPQRRRIQALVVTPTRELAIQIADSFEDYGKFTNIRTTVIFGGVKQGSQVNALKQGVDVLIATPGRLLDLINQGFISLRQIEYFVLDEADQMLDMGFIHDIKRIIALLPRKRQSLFFSATMPPSIVKLSKQILGEYQKVTIEPDKPTAEKVSQQVYYVRKLDKPKLLIHLLQEENYYTTLVFSRTKYGADKIVGKLKRANINAEAIHGNKSQNARQRALNDFKKGKTAVLVATDIAARGIDVDDLSLVVNFNLPNVAETYVHRIGRTGRAKASGKSISFCDVDEKKDLKAIERHIRMDIPVVEDHPFSFNPEDVKQRDTAPKQPNKGPQQRRHFHKKGNKPSGNYKKRRNNSGQKRNR
ncbi:MAG: DEAD/DEAH box helicase [Bacteroidia bacterium]